MLPPHPASFLPYLQDGFRGSERLDNCRFTRRKGPHSNVCHAPTRKYHLHFMYSRNKCSLCKGIILFVVKAASATLTDGCDILGKSSQSLLLKETYLCGSSRLLTKVLIYKGTMHHWNYINWIKPPLRKRTYVSRRKIKFKLLWVGMVSRRLWTIWTGSKSP